MGHSLKTQNVSPDMQQLVAAMRDQRICIDPGAFFGIDIPDAMSNTAVLQATGLAPDIERCSRPVDIPVLEQLGLPHDWLKIGTVEAGLGVDGGGVPGQRQSSPDKPWAATAVNDHAGEAAEEDAVCDFIDGVDPMCVAEKMTPGPTGKIWWDMNCWDYADEVLDSCAVHPPSAPQR